MRQALPNGKFLGEYLKIEHEGIAYVLRMDFDLSQEEARKKLKSAIADRLAGRPTPLISNGVDCLMMAA